MGSSIVRNELGPEPMCLPHFVHLLNWDVLGFGHKEVDEDGHYDDTSSEEVEQGELHVAEQGEEDLANDEGE